MFSFSKWVQNELSFPKCGSFPKRAYIFEMCFHFPNVILSSEWALIFEMCFYSQNVLQMSMIFYIIFFSKIQPSPSQFHFNFHSNINDVIILLNTQTIAEHLFTLYPHFIAHNTSHYSIWKKYIWKGHFCWNILSLCICRIVDVTLNFGLMCKKAKTCWALSKNFSVQVSW